MNPIENVNPIEQMEHLVQLGATSVELDYDSEFGWCAGCVTGLPGGAVEEEGFDSAPAAADAMYRKAIAILRGETET